MALHNRDIALQSRAALQGKWGLAIGGTLLYGAVVLVASFIPYLSFLNFLVAGPMMTGLAAFYLKLARNGTPEIADVFSGFSNYVNALVASLLVCLFVLLWTLLLIVPGIVATFAYSQTFYIVADNPDMPGPEALRLSKAMMRGFKGKLFYLLCRYIGWFLLGCVTLGIAFIWVFPMIYTALAAFYDDVKADYEARIPPLILPSNPIA